MNEWFEWREAPTDAQYAVLGDPVAHSRSPAMQNAALEAMERNERYTALRVPLEDFEQAMAHLVRLGYQGVNVTTPLKEAAFAWAVSHSRAARSLGVVNTLVLHSRHGLNTDMPGFVATIWRVTHPGRRSALILGMGGAGRAVALGLAEEGWRLTIWNRTRSKAETAVHELGLSAEVVDVPRAQGHDLIVNATSGVRAVELPIDWADVSNRATAYDLMYGAEPTPFLKSAAEAGLATLDGRYMLVEQGRLAMRAWTGEMPDGSVMLRAVERSL